MCHAQLPDNVVMLFVVLLTPAQAGFGNRQSVQQSPDAEGQRCRVRSRLTPSLPSKAGAMWYSVPVPVTRGFETLFTFQVREWMQNTVQAPSLLHVPPGCQFQQKKYQFGSSPSRSQGCSMKRGPRDSCADRPCNTRKGLFAIHHPSD